MASTYNIGIVILAAGASTRLGKPKQLLQYNGKSLLQHIVSEALKSNAGPVIVVVGANADSISKEIDKTKVHVVMNTAWGEGMASSVRIGLKTLQKLSPSTDGVIIMVCDQPHVSDTLIKELINTHKKTNKPIVGSNYGEAIGPPALFHRSLFSELMQLRGDTGARKIMQHHIDEVETVLFSRGKIDIDTKEDYEAFKNS